MKKNTKKNTKKKTFAGYTVVNSQNNTFVDFEGSDGAKEVDGYRFKRAANERLKDLIEEIKEIAEDTRRKTRVKQLLDYSKALRVVKYYYSL